MTSHSWENHKVIWKIFQFQYSFHTFETSIYIYDIIICFAKVWKTKKQLMKIIKQKKQLMKIISILVSNPWLSELGSHHHIPAAVTPRWPLWRYSRCCSPPMRAQVAKWRWLRWALLEIVVGCGQSMSISCTFPIQKMSFWEKWKKYGVCLKLTKRYQPAKITVWERVPLGIRASTREPVPVRCQILQHQCPGRC